MAGTTHYGYTFKSESGTLWAVAIKDTTYAGATLTALKPDSVGFNLNWEGATSETYQQIVGSTFEAGVYRDANSLALLEAIIAGIDCQFIVEITKTASIVWRGFLLQDSMVKPDSFTNVDTLKLKAVDGFGLLKDLDYDSFDPDALTQTTWINFFAKLMPHLPLHFIGAGEKVFSTASIWYEDSMASGSGDDPLANTIIKESAFIEVDSYGEIKALSYYDILSALLTTFNLQVVQWNGFYLIIQQNTYTQSTTRVWNYDLEGNFIDTAIMPLTQTMPTRLSGGEFQYILPVKEVSCEYDYKQGIFKNNLFPSPVSVGNEYNFGELDASEIVCFDGAIETECTFPATSPGITAYYNFSLTYNFEIKYGSYYLAKVSSQYFGESYIWTLIPSTINLTSRTFDIYNYTIDSLVMDIKMNILIWAAPTPYVGGTMTFEYNFVGINNFVGYDVATATPLDSYLRARIMPPLGYEMEGTELYKATTANSARVDLELEKAILGDGVLKYSAGALTINDSTSTLVKSNAWWIYPEIGGTAMNLNSLRCREMLALRKSTVRLYSGTYKGIPNIHLAFGWAPGMNYMFNSVNFSCNAEEYSATVMGVNVSRTAITVATPLTSQDQGGSGGGSSSTGGGSSPDGHSRLHNVFDELDHSGTGGTAKTTPIDADSVVIIDSADSSKVKRTTWANIKATIGSFWSRDAGTSTVFPTTNGDHIVTNGTIKSCVSNDSQKTVLDKNLITQTSNTYNQQHGIIINAAQPAVNAQLNMRSVLSVIAGTGTTSFNESIVAGETWTSGSKAVKVVFQSTASGSVTPIERLRFDEMGAVVVNDTGVAMNFRVEGDTDSNLLLVDGTYDQVGVGTDGTTDTKLHVQTGSTWGKESVKIEQGDADKAFIDFVGTSSANGSNNISSTLGTGTVVGPKQHAVGIDGWIFVGMVKIEVNGSEFWMPYYTWDAAL